MLDKFTVEKVYKNGSRELFTNSEVNSGEFEGCLLFHGWGVLRNGVLIKTEIYGTKKTAVKVAQHYNFKMGATEEQQYA